MPPIAFLRGWLLILLLAVFFFLDFGAFSNFVSQSVQHFSTKDILQLSDKLIDYWPKRWRPGPNIADRSIHLLNVVCLFIIWRTVLSVKRRIDQWTEHQAEILYTETNAVISEVKDLKKNIKVLRQQLKGYKITVASTKLENEELKESCKTYSAHSLRMEEENCELKDKLEMEKEIFEADRKSLEKKHGISTNLLQEKAQTLQQKLAQEELFHRERETKVQSEIKAFEMTITAMTMERQEKDDSYKTQIKELEVHLQNSLEQERQMHKDEINSELERMTNDMQEMESSLKKNLAQEELLHRERETKLQSEIQAFGMSIKAMTMEWQEKEDSYKTQMKELERFTDLENSLSSSKSENQMLKESLKACSRTSENSAQEIHGLQKTLQQEREIQQNKITSLKSQLERMTNEKQEMESTVKKELAQKEVEIRDGILKVAKQRQSFLKDELRLHQNKARENLMACRESERALARERNKTEDLHKKLEELSNQLAVYSGESQMSQKPQAPRCEKDVSTQSGHPSQSPHSNHRSTSIRRAVDQDRGRRQWDEGQPAFHRAHRGYWKKNAPDNR